MRDAQSYKYGHIPGAINIYYDPTADRTVREMILVALPNYGQRVRPRSKRDVWMKLRTAVLSSWQAYSKNWYSESKNIG